MTGTVFLDFNANGLLDAAGTVANVGSGTTPTAADAGVGGVVVTAFDPANAAQGVATSAADGSYTLALANTGPYRLEFTNLPTGLSFGPQAAGASGSGTGVQFVADNPPPTPVNLSLVRPTGVTADSPTLVNNVYYFGTTAGATLVSYPYNAGASAAEANANVYTQPTPPTTVATNAQVGATWGLAYDAASNRTFAAAFTKRHTSFGPGGPGAIYAVDATGATAPALFIDLGAAAAGADFRTGGGYDYFTDTAAFDAVGKTGLGGLDVDDTGTFLYTVGLADRRLYRVALNPDGTAGTVTSFALPVPATASSGGVDLRPFAVEFHDGRVYVGAVDTAETSGQASDLTAYVFAFDPAVAGGSFVNLAGTATVTEAVLTTPLDYARGYVHPGDSNNPIPGEWNPWTPTPQTLANPGENYGIFPQPMLTGLAFDDAGNVTLGLRDRGGDQFGFLANADFPAGLTNGISAGDVLRAFVNTPGDLGSGWAVESNGNGTGGAGNGQGPGGGEFYFQDELPGPGIGPGDDHQEVTVGGLLQLPGRNQVLVTAFDPVRIAQVYNAGGVRWFDTTDGTLSKAYQVFATGGAGSTFAKAAGIGDIVAVTALGREIGNRVWNDTNGNGRQDADEAGIQGVTVVLFQADAGGNAVAPLATATTDADGEYYFSSNPGTNTANAVYGLTPLNTPAPAGGSYQVRIPQAQAPLTGLTVTTFQAAGTNAQNDSDGVAQGTDYVIANVGTQPLGTADHTADVGFVAAQAQLSGFVYEDGNNSNTFNAGDTPIAGVTVVLTGTLTAGGTATPLTTTTDGTGFYSFTNLAPGSYTVTETQPAGFVSRGEQPGTTTGTATQNGTVISAIPLAGGQNSQNNNFGEVRLVQLSGFVYHDVTDDGTFNAGDAPIPGTTVVLTGVDDLGATVTPVTSTTAADGSYAFTALRPGSYTVSETQPAGFSNRTNNPGTVTNGTPGTVSGDSIQTIVLNSNANSPNNNFGELLTANATLSGFVYEDNDRSSSFNAGDTPIPGTTVVLTGTLTAGGTATPRTTTTDGTGFYSFTSLAPGSYTVSETQPAGFLDFNDQIGSTNGTVGNDVLSAIPVDNGLNINSQNNNFGEVRAVQLSGFVYEDVLNNGVYDVGTDAPIPGTTVVLTGVDDLGATVTPVTSTTAADGSYAFTALRPGNYTVSEAQPLGFLDRTNTPGPVTNGTPGTVVGDAIQTVVLNSNASSPNNNFGEVRPAQLSGFVYEDVNNSNSLTNAVDRPIPGTVVVLTGTLTAGGTATPLTATTDATGFYSFTNLAPGSYTVTETQPAGFVSRGEQFGSTGGTAPQNGTVISAIPLAGGQNSQNNNFGEVRPVSVSGTVYQDVDDNGVPNVGDVGIPGVTVVLTGTDDLGNPVTLTQTTDANGAYQFAGLRPGTYRVAESQPAGFDNRTNTPGPVTDGTGTPGTVSGDVIQGITLNSGAASPSNDFGETARVARLSGFVYRDPNLNGVREPGNGNEPGIAGVVVTLFREDGPGVLTPVGQTVTDANGFYQFVNLTPGLYRVAEAQPANFRSTQNAAGTTGGTPSTNDTIFAVPLAGGQNSTDNNFGEVPCTTLFGYVWVDGNQNGQFDPGEAPVAGAQVTLTGTAFAGTSAAAPITAALAGGPLTVTTDGNGRWAYTCLPPGTYSVNQTNTPAGFTNFQSQNSSGLAVQGSSASAFSGVAAQTPARGPLNFGVVPSTPQPAGPASKTNFLGSSCDCFGNPLNSLVDPAVGSLNTSPPFNVGTAAPTYVAAAAGAGFAPVVRVFDYASQTEVLRIQAFEDGMTAGVRVATGDITGDGVPDVIAAAGPGAGPRVRVFDGVTGAAVRDFFAYPPQFRGGLYVATGDFNGDGRTDLVTGAGEGGGPNVRVFDGATGTLLTSFFAFDANQTGGARIAVGDFNGDGTPDIAASNGPGNTSLIRTFSGRDFGRIGQFTPYSATYTGGVFLAAGDVNGDGVAELVTGADQGGGPNVRVFNATTGQLRSSFFAYESGFTGGVRVAVRDITGDGNADIITGAGINGASRLRVFSGANLQPVEDFYVFNSAVRNGLFLG